MGSILDWARKYTNNICSIANPMLRRKIVQELLQEKENEMSESIGRDPNLDIDIPMATDAGFPDSIHDEDTSIIQQLRVLRVHPDAKLPSKATDEAACFDVFVPDFVNLHVEVLTKVPLGIKMAVPKGYCAQFYEKSGLALKGIEIKAGCIDSDYRGEINIVCRFVPPKPSIDIKSMEIKPSAYIFNKGDKIAQFRIEKVEKVNIVEVSNLDETERGEAGFGSTGR